MKAAVYEEYGPPEVIRLMEVEKPVPKDDEVLVRVHAASLNPSDWHAMRGRLMTRLWGNGLFKPKHRILGDDVAGRVEAIGSAVTQFKPGDEVFGISNFGAFAEYRCFPEDKLALKPAGVSFEDAATLPYAGIPALQGLRDNGRIGPGKRVLINGASGGIGTLAVQIAKSYGAEVTGVCSTGKMELVRSLGADHVIDYTKEDFTKGEERYDIILAVGGHHPIRGYLRALSPGGVHVVIGGSATQYFQALLLGPLIARTGSKEAYAIFGNPTQEDLTHLAELVESGKVKPFIDRRHPLSEVPEAIRYLEEGKVKGKVIITVEQE
jgi:NADPH:quinone reductase-like Zn-dependent oxidoreductase